MVLEYVNIEDMLDCNSLIGTHHIDTIKFAIIGAFADKTFQSGLEAKATSSSNTALIALLSPNWAAWLPRSPVFVPDPATMVNNNLYGGVRDSDGCLTLAGFSWCSYRSACVQDWADSMTGPCFPSRTRLTRPMTYGTTKYAPPILRNASHFAKYVDVTVGSAVQQALAPVGNVRYNFRIKPSSHAYRSPFSLANLTLSSCLAPQMDMVAQGEYSLLCRQSLSPPTIIVHVAQSVGYDGTVTIVDQCQDDKDMGCKHLSTHRLMPNGSYIPTASLRQSECQRRSDYMKLHCMKSCGLCAMNRSVATFNFEISKRSPHRGYPFSLANLTLHACYVPEFHHVRFDRYKLKCTIKERSGAPVVNINKYAGVDPWTGCPSERRCVAQTLNGTFSSADMMCCGRNMRCAKKTGTCVVPAAPEIPPSESITIANSPALSFECKEQGSCTWSSYSAGDLVEAPTAAGDEFKCAAACTETRGCTGYEIGSTWCNLWLYGACNTNFEGILDAPLGWKSASTSKTCTRGDISNMSSYQCPMGTAKMAGACHMVECPEHSSGYPECQCLWGGSLTWDHYHHKFRGECDKEPPLFLEMAADNCMLPGSCSIMIKPSMIGVMAEKVAVTLRFGNECGLTGSPLIKQADPYRQVSAEFNVTFPLRTESYNCTVWATSPGYAPTANRTFHVRGPLPKAAMVCTDKHELCSYWANHYWTESKEYVPAVNGVSECQRNALYMNITCPKACGRCKLPSCKSEDSFFGGYGNCRSYADLNAIGCEMDYDDELRTFAYESCSECSWCKNNGKRAKILHAVPDPTEKPTQSTQDSLIVDGTLSSEGCAVASGFSWCHAKLMCVQDWEGGVDGPCPNNRQGERNSQVAQCTPFGDTQLKSCDHLVAYKSPTLCTEPLSDVCVGKIVAPFESENAFELMCPDLCAPATEAAIANVVNTSGNVTDVPSWAISCNVELGFEFCAQTSRCYQSHYPKGIGQCESPAPPLSSITEVYLYASELDYTDNVFAQYAQRVEAVVQEEASKLDGGTQTGSANSFGSAVVTAIKSVGKGALIEMLVDSSTARLGTEIVHMIRRGAFRQAVGPVARPRNHLSPRMLPLMETPRVQVTVDFAGLNAQQLKSEDIVAAMSKVVAGELGLSKERVIQDKEGDGNVFTIVCLSDIQAVAIAEDLVKKTTDIKTAFNQEMVTMGDPTSVTAVTIATETIPMPTRYIGEQVLLRTPKIESSGLNESNHGQPRIVSSESENCPDSDGFSWCPVKNKCVQDFKGGIDGPCEGGDNSTIVLGGRFGYVRLVLQSPIDVTEFRMSHGDELLKAIRDVYTNEATEVELVSSEATLMGDGSPGIKAKFTMLPSKFTNVNAEAGRLAGVLVNAVEAGTVATLVEEAGIGVDSLSVFDSGVESGTSSVPLTCPNASKAECFDSEFSCVSCCSTGVSKTGLTCWTGDFTYKSCCEGEAKETSLAVESVPKVESTEGASVLPGDSVESTQCDLSNGFTWCATMTKCLQDWPGGIGGGPCPLEGFMGQLSTPTPTPKTPRTLFSTMNLYPETDETGASTGDPAVWATGTEFNSTKGEALVAAIAEVLAVNEADVYIMTAQSVTVAGESPIQVEVQVSLPDRVADSETDKWLDMWKNACDKDATGVLDRAFLQRTLIVGRVELLDAVIMWLPVTFNENCLLPAILFGSGMATGGETACVPGTDMEHLDECTPICESGFTTNLTSDIKCSHGVITPTVYECNPVCTGCVHGVCTAPDVCMCEDGYVTATCDVTVEYISYTVEVAAAPTTVGAGKIEIDFRTELQRGITSLLGYAPVDPVTGEARLIIKSMKSNPEMTKTVVELDFAAFENENTAESINKAVKTKLRSGSMYLMNVPTELKANCNEGATFKVRLVDVVMPRRNQLVYVGGDILLEIRGDNMRSLKVHELNRRAMAEGCFPFDNPATTQFAVFSDAWDGFAYLGGKRVMGYSTSTGKFGVYSCLLQSRASVSSALECTLLSTSHHLAFEFMGNIDVVYLEPNKLMIYDKTTSQYAIYLVHPISAETAVTTDTDPTAIVEGTPGMMIEPVAVIEGELSAFCQAAVSPEQDASNTFNIIAQEDGAIRLLCPQKEKYETLVLAGDTSSSSQYPMKLTKETLMSGIMPHQEAAVGLQGGFSMTYSPSTFEFKLADCTDTDSSDCRVITESKLESTPPCWRKSFGSCLSSNACGWCHSTQKCVEGSAAGACSAECSAWQYGNNSLARFEPNAVKMRSGLHNAGRDTDLVYMNERTMVRYEGETGKVDMLTFMPTADGKLAFEKVWEGSVPYRKYVAHQMLDSSLMFLDQTTGHYAIWQCHKLHLLTAVGNRPACAVVKTGYEAVLEGAPMITVIPEDRTLIVHKPSTGQLTYYPILDFDNETIPLLDEGAEMNQTVAGLSHSRILAVNDGYIIDFNRITMAYRVWLYTKDIGMVGPLANGIFRTMEPIMPQKDAQVWAVYGGDDRVVLSTSQSYTFLGLDFQNVWDFESVGVTAIGGSWSPSHSTRGNQPSAHTQS